MFLRFGQVVGQAGVGHAILILLCAKLITSLTSFSLSAIATNTRVKGGGAYYLISRSLGVEFGGGIGFVFYLAQSVSVAMYVIGFTEAFVAAYPELASNQQLVASIANAAVFITVLVGAGWTMRIQYLILLILGRGAGLVRHRRRPACFRWSALAATWRRPTPAAPAC